MFGYIRPAPGELKVCEHERFKACYCGLCRALGKRYGTAARFILNYELVFLSMLLWGGDEPLDIKRGRCMASPLRAKSYCVPGPSLDVCAGYNVILTWWKLRDSIADESFFRALPHKLAALMLRGAYKKAARDNPEFDRSTREGIESLSECENDGEDSLDRAADKFAGILCSAVPDGSVAANGRPLRELLYHTGRWIYIVDAYDDCEQDARRGRYNPISRRFALGGEPPRSCAESVKRTASHSNSLLCAAFELLPANAWTTTIENIVYLGMPEALAGVMNGTWSKIGKSR